MIDVRRRELVELEAMLDQLSDGGKMVPQGNGLDAVAMLRGRCEAEGIAISGDGFIALKDAALLLRRSPHTLRNWRDGDRRLQGRKRGARWEYSLGAVAAHLAASGEE